MFYAVRFLPQMGHYRMVPEGARPRSLDLQAVSTPLNELFLAFVMPQQWSKAQ
jgi:hypothetical protein